MGEHPIEGLMLTAMNSIRDMIDVDTIIGEPIKASNDIVVIPISKVSFGFVAGGSEFKGETANGNKRQEKDEANQLKLPFGGGAGAGVSLIPVAFLVIQGEIVKLLPVNHSTALDKILDYIPDLFEKVKNMAEKSINAKKEQTDKIISTIQKKGKKNDDGEYADKEVFRHSKEDYTKINTDEEFYTKINNDSKICQNKIKRKIEVEDMGNIENIKDKKDVNDFEDYDDEEEFED